MSDVRFIAETAFAHQGDSQYLEELVNKIVNGDASVVKFQIFLEHEYSIDHPMAQKCHDLMLPKRVWKKLIKRVKEAGKKVLILPVDLCALEWVIRENMADIIEVHSVNLFRKDFYNFIKSAAPSKEIILSISGFELYSIDFIVKKYKSINNIKLSLMLGFQSFPTNPETLGIRRVTFLSDRYLLDVGYADHTAWNEDSGCIIAVAIAMGAKSIEKHLVINPGEERLDFNSAIDISEYNSLITNTNFLRKSLGSIGEYKVEDVEKDYGNRRLKLICNKPTSPGESIKAVYKWTTKTSNQKEINSFLYYGLTSEKTYKVGDIIE